MKFEIDLTKKEYDLIMEKFGNEKFGNDGIKVKGAIKRLLVALSNFRKIFKIPEKGRARLLYGDEEVTIILDGTTGRITLHKKNPPGFNLTLFQVDPEMLWRAVEGLTLKKF